MDQHRFDSLTRSVSDVLSRRRLMRGLAATGLGLSAARLPQATTARKRKQPRLNAFGCVAVGKPCRGKDSNCCSGICQGKKPKKGKQDTSRCAGHDASTCQAGDHEPFCGESELVLCTTSTEFAGVCNTTTGNAGYCHASTVCFSCATDAACRQVCGARAACLTCAECTETGGTMCASPDDLGCGDPM